MSPTPPAAAAPSQAAQQEQQYRLHDNIFVRHDPDTISEATPQPAKPKRRRLTPMERLMKQLGHGQAQAPATAAASPDDRVRYYLHRTLNSSIDSEMRCSPCFRGGGKAGGVDQTTQETAVAPAPRPRGQPQKRRCGRPAHPAAAGSAALASSGSRRARSGGNK